MHRVVLAAVAIVALSGCSLGSKIISTGFGSDETPSIRSSNGSSAPLGGEPQVLSRPRRERQAALNRDVAPAGSYARVPKGSLADRNYASVRLDIESARKLVNDYRRSKGLKTLNIDPQLTSAAKAHSRDLARWDRISHYGSDGSNPWDRVKRTGYNARLAAENVGTGQSSIEEVFKGWQKSPGHNKNLLLADADQMGIALVHDPKTEFKTFWTLVIGARL